MNFYVTNSEIWGLCQVAEVCDGQDGRERGVTTEWRDGLVDEASDPSSESWMKENIATGSLHKKNSYGMKHTLPGQKPQ